MEKNELIHFFKTHRIQLPNLQTEDELRKILSQKERTRTLGMWHDHSTILGHEYIMITVRVLYDQAVCKTDTELFGQELFHNIQSFIEDPEIHILAMSSSCAEDQAALVQDRVNCIKSSLLTCAHLKAY